MLSILAALRSDKRQVGNAWYNENLADLMLAGSPHTSCLTPEGSKVGRPHGNTEGSASQSEVLKAIL
jgi:hypothetical protein